MSKKQQWINSITSSLLFSLFYSLLLFSNGNKIWWKVGLSLFTIMIFVFRFGIWSANGGRRK